MASTMRACSARRRSWSRPPYATSCVSACLNVYSRSGKSRGLVEELRGLQARELGAHLVLRRVGDRQEQRHGHVLADDGGGLEQALVLGRQAVDARGQDRLHRGRDLQVLDGPGEPIGAALADQRRRLHQGPHALLEEERIAFRPLDQELLERAEGRVGAEERLEQLVGALGRQGIDPELAVVGLAAPARAGTRAGS